MLLTFGTRTPLSSTTATRIVDTSLLGASFDRSPCRTSRCGLPAVRTRCSATTAPAESRPRTSSSPGVYSIPSGK
ncbi:hypothetical protein BJX65DRAFT_260395 [Aspergillus insuetus]